jgi:hypothetical protein
MLIEIIGILDFEPHSGRHVELHALSETHIIREIRKDIYPDMEFQISSGTLYIHL